MCLEGQKVQKHGLSQVSERVPTWWSGRRKGRLGGGLWGHPGTAAEGEWL